MTCLRGSPRLCRSFKDNTSWQHTFSSVPFLPRFIFKVHKFLSNCLPWNVLYPNLMHFFVRVDLPRIASPDKTPCLLFRFSLTLPSIYLDCFQIIKLRIVKLTKCFFFQNGGPAFDLCPLWQRDVHSLSTLHTALLWKPCPLSLHWAWHGRCRPPHCPGICWPRG